MADPAHLDKRPTKSKKFFINYGPRFFIKKIYIFFLEEQITVIECPTPQVKFIQLPVLSYASKFKILLDQIKYINYLLVSYLCVTTGTYYIRLSRI